ncbi:MAG: 4-hydroxy-tetrahydrodipicolinate reductase [Candidatus Sericytochromatia bacterium]|nr:4-hydroxy-tetrahydrodipicolinate reductase [Candidatus Sericytochromatia bacterium]
MIKILLNGATGKMGLESVKAIYSDIELELSGVIGRTKNIGEDIGKITLGYDIGLKVETEIDDFIINKKSDILLDISNAEAGYKSIIKALNNGLNCVTGSTGFSNKQLEEIKNLTEKNNLTTLVIPNFSIGAVLMMKFSAMAGKYFKDVEIIEMHHEKKKDAPSGTAIKTAEMIKKNNIDYNMVRPDNFETIAGSRGGNIENINIHSIRLPGFVATQEVIFGGLGQTLTIKHQTINREAYMEGLIFSLKKVREVKGYIYGLEDLL